MPDAPKRIWIDEWGGTWDFVRRADDEVPYVPESLARELADALEMLYIRHGHGSVYETHVPEHCPTCIAAVALAHYREATNEK